MPENNGKVSIKKTKDGSTTLFSHTFSQHYHNPNGAVAESRHVFFEIPGVPDALCTKKTINIFETGFGTGLNLLLLFDYLAESGKKSDVTFYSVEAFPVSEETVSGFEFGDNPGLNQSKEILREIFRNQKNGMNEFNISDHVTLKLYSGFFGDLFAGVTFSEKMDFIFHDPFSPDVNPGLWTADVFKKLVSISRDDVILSTYCAATSARAAMAAAGWSVARAQGALGKREMTIASLNPEKLNSFKRVNEKRLTERFKNGEF